MKSSRFKKISLIILAVIVIFFLAGLIGTPYLIDMGLERWLSSKGPEVGKVENIDFNPFSGRLSMDNLIVETQGGRTLSIPHASLEFSWKQLFKKQLYLKELMLQDAFMLVDRLEESGFRLGGLILRELTGSGKKSDKPGWEVGIDIFEMKNAQIEYDTPELAATYFIDQYTLEGLETWNKEKAVHMAYQGRINESRIHVKAEVNALDVVKTWKGSIVLENGSLELISKVRGLQEYGPKGSIDIDLQLDAQMQENGSIIFESDGSIALHSLQLRYKENLLQQENISWQGRMEGSKAAGKKLAVAVDGKLAGKDLLLEDNVNALQQQLAAFNWDGKAGFSRQEDAAMVFDADGVLALDKVHFQNKGHGLQQENITWQGRVEGRKAVEEGLAVSVDGELAGSSLKHDSRAKSLQTQLGAFTWQGKAGVSKQEDSLAVTMESVIDGENINVNDEQGNMVLLGLAKVTIAGLRIDGLEDILVSGVELHDLFLVEKITGADSKTNDKVPPLLQASKVEISKASILKRNDISIDNLNLEDLAALIHRNKDGDWQVMPERPASPETTKEKPASGAEKAAAEPGPISFRVNNLLARGKNTIRFEDESLRRPFRTTIHIDEFNLATVGTGGATEPGRFKVGGRIGDYGALGFDGTVAPGDTSISLDMKGSVSSLDMPPFSSYTGQTIGYNVTSGQMDADVIIKIDKGMLDSLFDLRMRNLEVARLDTAEMAEIDKQMDVPLGSALGMLRNKKDEINFKLEIKDDINNPQFGIQDAINQALAKAMKFATLSYLKYTLQPFGTFIAIAEVAGKAGKEMSKVGLDPVIFPAGEIVLDETAELYLEKVSEILNNRPKLRIELCGKAVVKDRLALVAKRQAVLDKEEVKGGVKQTKGPKEITVADEVLLDFAKERSKLVKDFLVNKHAIDHERLFLCLPALDDSPETEPSVGLFLD